jgi:hypothetical protein
MCPQRPVPGTHRLVISVRLPGEGGRYMNVLLVAVLETV